MNNPDNKNLFQHYQ